MAEARLQPPRLLSVNVGRPRAVDTGRRTVRTAIWKRPVDGRVAVRGVNLDGDDQADRTVHGGPDKAVYAYAHRGHPRVGGRARPRARARRVRREPDRRGRSTSRARCIGERWRVGTALLEVVQPRLPCFKLGLRMGDPRFVKRFGEASRPGAYLRIVEEGELGAGDAIEVDLDALPDHAVTSGSSPTRSSSTRARPAGPRGPAAPAVPARVAVGTRRRRGRLTHRPGAAEVRRPVRGPPQRGRHRAAREPTEVLMRSSPRAHQRISRSRRWWGALAVVALVALAVASSAVARRGGERGGDGSRGLGHYTQRDLVSDVPGRRRAPRPDLVNAWGLAFGPATPAWVADNGTGRLDALLRRGATARPSRRCRSTVAIPGGAPTGTVFNASTGFVVHSGTSSGAALLPVRLRGGDISGWSPGVPPPAPSTQAQVAVDRAGADLQGPRDRRHRDRPAAVRHRLPPRQVDVLDGLRAGATAGRVRRTRTIPAGFAPFGIQAIDGEIVVTYAKQDADRARRRRGAGQRLRRRLRHRAARCCGASPRTAPLNSPWGDRVGAAGLRRLQRRAAGRQLRRRAHQRLRPGERPVPGRAARRARAAPITIDGLWALRFGNGVIGTPRRCCSPPGPPGRRTGSSARSRPRPSTTTTDHVPGARGHPAAGAR